MSESFYDRPTTVYRLYNAAGELLYIGITVDWQARRSGHKSDKWWWPEVDDMGFIEYPCRLDAAIAERDGIIAELPRYNIVHHPDGRPSSGVRLRQRDPLLEVLTTKQCDELIGYIKALNVTREEAADIIHDTLTDMGVLRWPRGVLNEELAEAKAAQARRIARGASDPLPQGAA